MLSLDEALNILSLHERDGSIYEYRAVEDFDYQRCSLRDDVTVAREELFVHSSTARIGHLAELASISRPRFGKTVSPETAAHHARRAAAWAVIQEHLSMQEQAWAA